MLLFLLASPAARAQDPASCETAISTARDQYLRGGFVQARTLLEDCLTQNAFTDEDKPEVYKLLVRIYDAQGLEDQVKRFLAALLALVPNYEPDPSDPPSFVRLVEQFKSETNQPPQARFAANPTTGAAPLSVRFNATASSDPDGTIASYSWDFGDGTTGFGATVSHVYETAGTYVAELTVADDGGLEATQMERIEVAPQATQPVPGGGGGMRKWLFIGGGVALAGAATILLLPGSNPPPPTATIPLPPGRPGGN